MATAESAAGEAQPPGTSLPGRRVPATDAQGLRARGNGLFIVPQTRGEIVMKYIRFALALRVVPERSAPGEPSDAVQKSAPSAEWDEWPTNLR